MVTASLDPSAAAACYGMCSLMPAKPLSAQAGGSLPWVNCHHSSRVFSLPLSCPTPFETSGFSSRRASSTGGTIRSGWSQLSLRKVTSFLPPGIGSPSRYPSPWCANFSHLCRHVFTAAQGGGGRWAAAATVPLVRQACLFQPMDPGGAILTFSVPALLEVLTGPLRRGSSRVRRHT